MEAGLRGVGAWGGQVVGVEGRGGRGMGREVGIEIKETPTNLTNSKEFV